MPYMATGGLALTRNSSEIDLGSRLAAIRAQRGLSQGTVARLAGLPPSYLSRIETNHVHPTFSTVLRVLEALHAELTDLTAVETAHPRRLPACPVTAHGHCLLELIRGEVEVARADGREVYSMREVQLMRDVAAFIRKASPERARAIEALLQELIS